MFLHSTDDYDFLVQLDPKVLSRYFHNINLDNNRLSKRGKYANKLNGKDTTVLPDSTLRGFFRRPTSMC